jgi:hypothetical protein
VGGQGVCFMRGRGDSERRLRYFSGAKNLHCSTCLRLQYHCKKNQSTQLYRQSVFEPCF